MMNLDKSQTQRQQLDTARSHVAAFASSDNAQAVRAVLLTFALWIGGIPLGHVVFRPYQLSTWWGWILVAAWLLLRVGSHFRAFAIMHDSVHGSLFTHRWMNVVTSILCGFLVLMDGLDFRKTHCQHHAVLGMEEKACEDPAHFVLWTTKEWAAWPRGISKMAARILRDPLVFFIIHPPFMVLICNAALPQHTPHQLQKGARLLYLLARTALMLGILMFFMPAYWGQAHYLGELAALVLVCVYGQLLASAQHVFEGVYVEPRSRYNRSQASLAGSSCMIMPWWWRFATFGFEYHHIHHLNPHVPGYRIKECHESAPQGLWEELGIQILTWRTASHSLLLALWDPEARRYVPFPEWQWLEKILRPTLHLASNRQTCRRQ